jgi:hypothetical protein
MKYLTQDLIDNLNIVVGRDVVEGMRLMIKNGYLVDELMRMPVGDILEYYDTYCDTFTK